MRIIFVCLSCIWFLSGCVSTTTLERAVPPHTPGAIERTVDGQTMHVLRDVIKTKCAAFLQTERYTMAVNNCGDEAWKELLDTLKGAGGIVLPTAAAVGAAKVVQE